MLTMSGRAAAGSSARQHDAPAPAQAEPSSPPPSPGAALEDSVAELLGQEPVDYEQAVTMTRQSSSAYMSLPPVIYRMPNTAFGISMGLASHAIMWKELAGADFDIVIIDRGVVDIFNSIAWYSSAAVVSLIGILYAYKVSSSFHLVMAEWLNETRCHFFNAPVLIFVMLLIGLPSHINASSQTLRILWSFAFFAQVLMTSHIYKAWMFSKRRNFSEAKPQFLMSTVGWFLLCNLGVICDIKGEWGIGLPAMCFGAGFMLYIEIVIFIFGKLHENKRMKGSPGMFLIIAPPSVGVLSLELLDDDASDFSLAGEMLLGWVYVCLLLLFRLGPVIWRTPSVFGEYWAYVFPLASATTATIKYASVLNTRTTEVLALIMVVTACGSLFLVFCRMVFHIYRCLRGQEEWGDPLFDQEKYATRRITER